MLRHLKELAWATDKQLQVISSVVLFKTVTYAIKNKGILSLNNIVCIAM